MEPSRTLSKPWTDRPVLFRRARVILPDRVTPECCLLTMDGRIARIATEEPSAENLTVVDAAGKYLAPGLIDIHCHGDGESSLFGNVNAVGANLLKRGTTGVLATLGYTDMEPGNLHRQVEKFWQSRDELSRLTVLGVNLEGPYLNAKYGANQRLKRVHGPDPAEYDPVLEQHSKVVRLWTCAPELEGARAFIEAASARGIVLAAGHTEAGAEVIQPLISQGLRIATHWSNASGNPVTRFKGTKEPGIDELALVNDGLKAEVMADSRGCHVRPLMLQLLYRAKGPDGIILISDASFQRPNHQAPADAASDLLFLDGEIAGSRLCMIAAARNFRKHVGCGLPELFRMGALNPAQLFGWSRDLGSVETGKLANLILIDDELNIHGIWLQGRSIDEF